MILISFAALYSDTYLLILILTFEYLIFYSKYSTTEGLEKKTHLQNEKELALIEEVFEQNIEVLLWSITEITLELADILEETDQTLNADEKYNKDLR